MGCSSSTDKTSTTVSPNNSIPIIDINNTSITNSSKEKLPIAIAIIEKELTPLEKTRKLHTSIRWNKNENEIEALLEIEGSTEFVDPQNGNRPIHIAAQNGHVDIVKTLLKKGCDINSINLKGNTALHMAIGYDYYETAKLLIDSGANVDILNSSNFPASKGLEGDKSLATAAITAAITIDEYIFGLNMMKNQFPRGITKELFIKIGLKMKKSNTDEWNKKNVQDEFTTLLHNWDSEISTANSSAQ